MNNKFINDPNFTHCLRIQIFPDEYYQERIDSIIKFCLEYDFKNVILMFNGECFNVGHITNEQLKPWLDVMKKAKEQFSKVGITTSLNPWIEFGHLDRGRKLQEGQNFTNMMDKNGKSCELVACPLDPEWRKFYIAQMSYYVKELEPAVLWIEDDFRLHNHDPLEWGGCFCDIHMKAYSKRLGRDVTRENFVKALLPNPSEERKAWMDVSFETMDSLAKEISKAVKSLGVETSVALMSSMPEAHAMEARRWDKLLSDLSSDGKLINRIHLPMYCEMGAKFYYHNFNRISMIVRAFNPDEELIYPELENSSFSEVAKSPRMVKFQVESSIPLGLSGMTYDIFDFCGNGAQEELGYGKVLKEITPYLTAAKKLELKPSQLRGIVFPIDELTMKNRRGNKDYWLSLRPDEYDGVAYFAEHGYSYSLSKKKEYVNQTVALINQNIENFTNDQLIKLFENNYVVLDGYAAMRLIERGLGYLIHATNYENMGCNNGNISYETQVEPCYGIHNYRTCMEKDSNDYIRISYDESKVNVKSYVNKYDNTRVGAGVVEGNNFFALPFICAGQPYEQYSLLRVHQLKEASSSFKSELVRTPHQSIYPYLYDQEDRKVLVLVNANTDNFDNISFNYQGFEISNIEMVNRDGTISKVGFANKDGKVTIDRPLGYMSTAILIIK